MIGDIAAINKAIEALKNKKLVLKNADGLQDYLSCEINFSDDKKGDWIGQPHLIKNMEKKFGWLVQDVQSHKTLGTPEFLIMRPMWKVRRFPQKTNIIISQAQVCYCTWCQFNQGTIKSKQWCKPCGLQGAPTCNQVCDGHDIGLKFEPMGNSNKPWEIICFSNSDYAGDPVNRQSISGFILYVLDVLVSW